MQKDMFRCSIVASIIFLSAIIAFSCSSFGTGEAGGGHTGHYNNMGGHETATCSC